MPRRGLDTAAVVAAAAELADDEGLPALTLSGLADRLGIRAPSLYAHVSGLADLRRGVAALAARELAGALRQEAAGRAGHDALSAVAGAYRAYAREHPGRYLAMQRAPDEPGEDADAAAELYSVIRATLSAYGLGGESEVHGIRAVRATLHGFAALEQAGGFAMPVSTDASYARLIEFLHLGLTELGRG
ncbi:MAG TPA: TetR-like C-terminal domain-containing protein [Solirubrobacteraceae bacterium]|nr:TetR-like C-terminal domain-containing protein [Solirubrobacteraceae bacterium]